MFNRQRVSTALSTSGPGEAWRAEMRKQAGGESTLSEDHASIAVTDPVADSATDRAGFETAESNIRDRAVVAPAPAQQQAQRLLEQAAAKRSEATAQAEQILREARRTADRLCAEAQEHEGDIRGEAQRWASEQRRAVEELVRDLTVAAQQDAQKLRAEATSSAMAEAEEQAERHVTRLVAAGRRDADALRAEARGLLEQSTSLVADAQRSVQALADTVAIALAGLEHRADDIDALLRGAGSDTSGSS